MENIRETHTISVLTGEPTEVQYQATLSDDCIMIQPVASLDLTVVLPDNPKIGQCITITHLSNNCPWTRTVKPSKGALLSDGTRVDEPSVDVNPGTKVCWTYAEVLTEVQVSGTLNSLGDKFYSKDLLKTLNVKEGDVLLFNNGGLLRTVHGYSEGVVQIDPTWAPSGGPLYTAKVRYTQGIWWRS